MASEIEQSEYRVLALKYRPQVFTDVVGQQAVVRQLQGEIMDNRVGHAYLFTGPRGVGKTSMARIFAKALNCVQGPTPNPCGKCVHCQGIANDADMDVVEVDAATYTRKEETIELLEGIDRVSFSARYKVYIIDEVHMFSIHSFNVLLKRLEEPPPRVVFILATTNPEKIPDTVLSRCRRLEFDRMETTQIMGRLVEIAEKEGVNFAEGDRERVLEAIALASEGGMRDSQVAFDQLISLSEGNITFETARQLLGVVESDLLHRLFTSITDRHTVDCLLVVHELVEKGRDLPRFIKTFTGFLRDAMLAKAGAPDELMKVCRANPGRLKESVGRVSLPTILNMMQQFLDLEGRMKGAAPARFLLEFALMKLTAIHPHFVLDAMDPEKLRAITTAPPPSGSGAGAAESLVLPEQPAASSPSVAPSRNGWNREAHGKSLMPAAAPVMHDSALAAPLPVVVVEEESPDSGLSSAARILEISPSAEQIADFRQRIASAMQSLSASLLESEIHPASGDTVVITLPPHDRLLKAQFEKPDRMGVFLAIAREVFQRPFRVRIEVGTAVETSAPAPANASLRLPDAPSPQAPATRPAFKAPASNGFEDDDDVTGGHIVDFTGDQFPQAGKPMTPVDGMSLAQAMEKFPDLREVVMLLNSHLGTEPAMMNGKRLQ